MFKYLFFAIISVFILSCTNLDNRHVFNYKITGTAEKVSSMKVIMGPGIDYDSEGEINLPVDIVHDVYGDNLIYLFEISHSDVNADVKLEVYIDDELIEEKSQFTTIDGVNVISIEGVFSED